ncbi:MAG: hypothetical protein ACM3MI_00720 [Clostridiales bacterium]
MFDCLICKFLGYLPIKNNKHRFNISRSVKITDEYFLPVGLMFAYNPHLKNSYNWPFKVSLC